MDQGFGKKYYALLTVGVLLLLISTIVYAEAATSTSSTTLSGEEEISTSSTSTDISESSTSSLPLNNEITEISTTPVSEPQTLSTTLDKVKQNRITNLCANISNRFEAVIYRQSNIADRLQTRLTKMKAENLNTNEGEEKLRIAMTTINQARDTMKNIDASVHKTVTAINPKVEWLSLRSTYLETDLLVKQAQEELEAVVLTLLNSTGTANTPTTPNEPVPPTTSTSTAPNNEATATETVE